LTTYNDYLKALSLTTCKIAQTLTTCKIAQTLTTCEIAQTQTSIPKLNAASPASKVGNERNQEQHQENYEEKLGDSGCGNCYSREA